MFWSSMKVQLQVMVKRREFQFGFLVMILYACAAFVYSLSGANDRLGPLTLDMDIYNFTGANEQVAYTEYHRLWNMFAMLYPILIVLPFATSYVDDYKHQLLPVYLSRAGRRSYYGSKLLTAFVGTFLTVAIPFLLNLLLCNLFLPHNHNTYLGGYQCVNYYTYLLGTGMSYEAASKELAFLELYLAHPFLYNLWHLLLFSLLSGLLGSLVMSLSFLFRKWKIVLFAPLFILFQFLAAITEISLTKAINGGGIFVNYNPLSYVIRVGYDGLSGWYITFFCLAAVGVIAISMACGVKQELKSIQ